MHWISISLWWHQWACSKHPERIDPEGLVLVTIAAMNIISHIIAYQINKVNYIQIINCLECASRRILEINEFINGETRFIPASTISGTPSVTIRTLHVSARFSWLCRQISSNFIAWIYLISKDQHTFFWQTRSHPGKPITVQ